ncbi:hypothetical protein TMatcc_007241 [Talaromyces marneffei ATCC 18224]
MKQNQFGLAVGLWQRRLLRGPCLTHTHRFFSSQHPSQQQCQSTKNNNACSKSSANRPYTSPKTSQPQLRSIWDSGFWTCKSTWRRARINTLRCLIGCTAGDFSALWTLQTFYPGLGMGVIMGASSNHSLSPPFLFYKLAHALTTFGGKNSGIGNNNLHNSRNNSSPSWRGPTLMADGGSHSDGDEYGLNAGHGSRGEYC